MLQFPPGPREFEPFLNATPVGAFNPSRGNGQLLFDGSGIVKLSGSVEEARSYSLGN